ncbi:hypothetical protein OEZ86_013955 [Tetradesmus obliquus]|nr:hypothetical protein OEZ86_013955 [Tetradesmus obliquus]
MLNDAEPAAVASSIDGAVAAAAAAAGGPAPAEALAGAKQCVCPRGHRQVLGTEGCVCECDSGFQGSPAAKRAGCTTMFPNDAAAAPRACRCVRCPAGTQSGGGNMTADLCAAPEKTADAAGDVSAQQLGSVPYNAQCGGRGSTVVNGRPGCGAPGMQCWDAPWTGTTCQAGTVCQRSNEWWWFCNWGSTPTRPIIPAWAQCGGRSSTPYNGLPGCGSTGRECADRAWSGVTCVAGHSCQRDNEWWWGCKPGGSTDPCAGRTCSGRGSCSNGVCSCQAGWSGANCEIQAPQPPASGGCPAGWERAVGTLYDSWPKPGTTECVQYSGCRWAGLFSSISAGPLFNGAPCNANQCLARNFMGMNYRAQCLNGGNGEVACRWPESAVRAWRMGATWDQRNQLLNGILDVMVEGVPGRVTRVNIQDVCNDNDCAGCCSRNTGNGAYPLIDIEKWAALDLLQNFDPNQPNFDINNVAKPTAGGRRPGVQDQNSVMPLCYRRVGTITK